MRVAHAIYVTGPVLDPSGKNKVRIIIIGAGAAGLKAGLDLVRRGMEVMILEAAPRVGGRVRTETPAGFEPWLIDTGPEFIHGLLPVTLSLLAEAGIEADPINGKFIDIRRKGQAGAANGFQEKVAKKVKQLDADMTVDSFLEKYFYDSPTLCDAVVRFAEGFDLANTARASIRSLAREWTSDLEDSPQKRVHGGYARLPGYMAAEITRLGGGILTDHRAEQIHWKPGEVGISCANGRTFTGSKLIVTVPLPFLTGEGSPAIPALRFDPLPDKKLQAAKQIGYGHVLKTFLLFGERFWERAHPGAGFILSDEAIPTWWTHPSEPLLTGWLGGPASLKWKDSSDDKILEAALNSVASIAKTDRNELTVLLKAGFVRNWNNDPYAAGGYSYPYPETTAAVKELQKPLADTIYFAGEAVYEGGAPGTVEAALVSGTHAAMLVS